MRKLILLLAIAGIAQAQRGTYTAEYKVTLSSSASVVVIQLPADATARSAQMVEIAVGSSEEIEVTIERGGTLASGTEITPVATQSAYAAASAKVYHTASHSGASVMARATVPAGQTVKFPASDVAILRAATPESVVIRTASGSGTVITNLKWREY